MKNNTIDLQVKGITYFKTNRGVGYNCLTNIEHIHILNDGVGGETYLYNYGEKYKILNKLETQYDEFQLESLIDKYENVDRKF
tara:strand:+ start:3184 stop:3432 length:249 start_codon:yes stop_codon:yes gene_type:complete